MGWDATAGWGELSVWEIPWELGAAGRCPTDQAARRDSTASTARFAKKPLSVCKLTVFFALNRRARWH